MAEYVIDGSKLSREVAEKLIEFKAVHKRIVRCKDCRWYGKRRRMCTYRPIDLHLVHPDHWCALGEVRKDD